jgi:dTDP-4-dehydrorhamnose reductase
VKIFITGAAGLVGSHLAQRLAREHEVVALKHGDLEITDRAAVNLLVAKIRPSLIINCVVNGVDECERYPDRAEAVNVQGPHNLAAAAAHVDAEIVHFGTNYNFGGKEMGRAPYTIDDVADPVNVYGRAKIAGEQAVREACARSYIIRTAWVYGEGKNVFICTVHGDLLAKKRVQAIADVWSPTTYILDLTNRVREILKIGRHGTFHVVNEGICSCYEFALEAGRLLGLDRSELDDLIETVKDSDMNRPALRPRYTPMRCLLSEEIGLPPMRDWKAALAEYVRS